MFVLIEFIVFLSLKFIAFCTEFKLEFSLEFCAEFVLEFFDKFTSYALLKAKLSVLISKENAEFDLNLHLNFV